MKRIETRDNEFLEQFRRGLRDSFPNVLNFRVDYYVEGDETGKALCFSVLSEVGVIFSKRKLFANHQTPLDVEDEFMNEVIDSLVMAGVTFANFRAFESVSPERVDNEVKAKRFRHQAPRKIVYLN